MLIESDKLVNNPLVSVVVITYNQEKTIAQTIESILMQKGDFSIELIIGEDYSNDRTRDICIEFQKKHKETIKLLLQEKNQGLVKNFVDSISLCSGQFICNCAGDDYWIDDRKIEKQLAFLNDYPDYGIVTTGGYRLITSTNKLIEGIPPLSPPIDGYVFDLTWKGGVYAMPLSLMIRSALLKHVDFNEFIKRNFSVEDVPLQAILAAYTKFGHIPDRTCVYRVNSKSATFINLNSNKYLDYHKGLVEIRRYLHELFPDRVPFSEEWATNYLTYRKFLIATKKLNYKEAKQSVLLFINPGTKENKAISITNCLITFYAFAIAKQIKINVDTWKNSLR